MPITRAQQRRNSADKCVNLIATTVAPCATVTSKRTRAIKPEYDLEKKCASFIPQELIGRANETKKISGFVLQHISNWSEINDENTIPYLPAFNCLTSSINSIELTNAKSVVNSHISKSSLYIAGSPGCGKTAAVNFVLDSIDLPKSVTVIFLNCLSLSAPSAVFSAIESSLDMSTSKPARFRRHTSPENTDLTFGPTSSKKSINFSSKFAPYSKSSSDDLLLKLRSKLSLRERPIILVLDEIDNLISRHQPLLYSIFELASIPHVALIAIANSIDLTERFLPLLSVRKCQPEVLNFVPYSQQTIANILGSLFPPPKFSTSALALISRKPQSHDLRWATSICRKAAMISSTSGAEVTDVVHVLNAIPKETSSLRQIMELALPGRIALVALLPRKRSAAPSYNLPSNPESFALVTLGSPEIAFSQPDTKLQHSSKSIMAQSQKNSGIHSPQSLTKGIRISAQYTIATWHSAFAAVCCNPILALPPLAESDFLDLATRLESTGLVRLRAPVAQKTRTFSGGASCLLFSSPRKYSCCGRQTVVELGVSEEEVLRGATGGTYSDEHGTASRIMTQIIEDLNLA